MVGYDYTEGILYQIQCFPNYPTLSEQSVEHVKVHHVDVDGLKDGRYHPNMADFE